MDLLKNLIITGTQKVDSGKEITMTSRAQRMVKNLIVAEAFFKWAEVVPTEPKNPEWALKGL